MDKSNVYEEQDNSKILEKRKFLTISIDSEVYGIKIEHVNDINRIQDITEVPHQKPYLMGIINLRGQIIPVIDIRKRFDKDVITYDDRTCIIVINYEGDNVGLIVDRVEEVLAIPVDLLGQSESGEQKSKFIKGIIKFENQIITLLDIERILFG